MKDLFFYFSWFFRLNGKCFCEQGLVFVKQMSKKAFCSCLHIPQALISGLPLVKPFSSSLSIFCSFGLTWTSIKVVFSSNFSRNLEHYYVPLLWYHLFCSSLHELYHNFDDMGIDLAFLLMFCCNVNELHL